MSLFQRHIGWAVLASELSHVFCCVLPTCVTIFGALINVGLVTAAPRSLMVLHETLHAYEVPIILFSAVMVLVGWGVYYASAGMDCHDTGCCHPPCDPVKSKNARVLVIATILFVLNLVIYFGVHRNVLQSHVLSIVPSSDTHKDSHHEQDN